MRLNTSASKTKIYTHEGGPARHISTEAQLRRSVLSCLLWEKTFYESGEDIAQRISTLADKVDKDTVLSLAMEARNRFHLRHVPLLLLIAAVKKGGEGVADAIAATIQRPDEMAELLAMYWHFNPRKDSTKIPSQLKKGLARAFGKFDEYQLAKWDKAGAVSLRDVLFLSHAKPQTEEQEALFKRIANKSMATPDTWETNLSAGADKRETFERLLSEGKLGYLALLRNLRGMAEANVDEIMIRDAILARKGARRVLPFRYVAAARAAPRFESFIDQALCDAVAASPPMDGKTIILVDVSGSMRLALSGKSDLTRMDAAAALASVINGDVRMFSFSAGDGGWLEPSTSKVTVEVPPRRAMAGVDAIINSQAHGGTRLGKAVEEANELPHDRLIVITDEQSADRIPDPVAKRAYMINVATNKNGVGYGRWVHIDGFSEAVLRFIEEYERQS